MIPIFVTSIPNRVDSLIICLDSLKFQTVQPSKVYIVLSHFYHRFDTGYFFHELKKLNSFLKDFSIRHEIVWGEDLGPISKVAFISSIAEDEYAITIDDDSILYYKAIEIFLANRKNYPNDVLALSGVIEEPHKFVHGELVDETEKVDIIAGYRGVFYPVKILNHIRSWIENFKKIHEDVNVPMLHDDHIISFFLERYGITKRVCKIEEKTKLQYFPIENSDGVFSHKMCRASSQLTFAIERWLHFIDSSSSTG